jgi:hypothetical protein
MKHSSFNRGMAKLQQRGVSKTKAFNRMSALSWKNRTYARQGQTAKSRFLASHNLHNIACISR